MPHFVTRLTTLRLALAASTALAAPAAYAQTAPAADTPAPEAIVVTGFRRSLEAALNLKKNSVSAVDAIVAEDIAKFPDQNLAESLQRIPGISIVRDGGEGRSITVRGLSSQFTRVRVNGLETIATSTDGASANRDRAFDFNVFASELFSSLVVHKTAEASLDEGSLGAVVDLNTGNPLAGKAGVHGVFSAVGQYNDLAKKAGPRLAGMLSWKNDASTFGVSVSAAYSKMTQLELGNNSVRWVQTRFDSVNGTPCYYNSATGTTGVQNSGGVYTNGRVAACDQAALSFHPRIPRYGEITHRRERLGLTGSMQWKPSEKTKIALDGLYSRFKEDREEKWGEVLLRSNERSIDVVNPVYDSNNNMVSATLNDAWVRTEHYLRKSSTEFYQVGLTWDQDITDKLRFTAVGGMSKSNANIPVETTLLLDNRSAQGYSYDYTNMASPKLSFGTSMTDPANFQLSEIRDRPSNTTNKYKTFQLRAEWDVAEGFQIKAGGMWRRFNYDVSSYTRDTTVCGNGGTSLVTSTSGTINCSLSSAFGPTAVYGFPAAGLTEQFNLGSAGQPAGTTNSWLIANIPAAAAYTQLYSRPLIADAGNIRGVTEETKGGYIQFDAKGNLLGVEYALNAGTRYVRTDQSSYGLVGTVTNTIKRNYDNWLPSMNLAIFATPKFIIRGAVADVMTRPSLGSLTPGGSADGFNYRVTTGNPYLEPYRARNYDLSLEWYFAPQALASVALFRKEVGTFTQSGSITGLTYAQTGAPISSLLASSPAALSIGTANNQLLQPIWTLSTTVNGSGASLQGIEVALQLPFRTFVDHGFFSNVGWLANATFIDSKATFNLQGPATVPGGALNNVTVTNTLSNVSKVAWNSTVYYDDGKFSARVMLSYRGRFHEGASGTGNVLEGYGATTNLDASIRYKVTPSLEVSLEGNNLLDTYRYRFTDWDANRNYENNHFGRNILLGARYKY